MSTIGSFWLALLRFCPFLLLIWREWEVSKSLIEKGKRKKLGQLFNFAGLFALCKSDNLNEMAKEIKTSHDQKLMEITHVILFQDIGWILLDLTGIRFGFLALANL